MFKNPKRTLLCLGLVIGLLGMLLGSVPEHEARLATPTIHVKTAEERWAALDALRNAWSARPEDMSAANEKAERQFLNRLIYFVRGTRGQEVYGDACRLWNECYHDHALHYRDFVDPN